MQKLLPSSQDTRYIKKTTFIETCDPTKTTPKPNFVIANDISLQCWIKLRIIQNSITELYICGINTRKASNQYYPLKASHCETDALSFILGLKNTPDLSDAPDINIPKTKTASAFSRTHHYSSTHPEVIIKEVIIEPSKELRVLDLTKLVNIENSLAGIIIGYKTNLCTPPYNAHCIGCKLLQLD